MTNCNVQNGRCRPAIRLKEPITFLSTLHCTAKKNQKKKINHILNEFLLSNFPAKISKNPQNKIHFLETQHSSNTWSKVSTSLKTNAYILYYK